jgi:hypothetical protein
MRLRGLWRDTRSVYAAGASIATIGGCALGIAWSEVAMPWRELVGYSLVTGVPGGLIVGLCSVFGYHMVAANPDLHPVARWFALCLMTWIFLAAFVLALLVGEPRFGG